MKRIKVITPILTERLRDLADLRAPAHAGLKIELRLLREGLSKCTCRHGVMDMADAIRQCGLRHRKRGWRASARKPITGYTARQAAMG